MDQRGGAPGPAKARQQAADLSLRQPQVHGRLLDRQPSGQDTGERPEALLGTGIQPDRLPRLHGIEGDKVAVPLARTESLSGDILVAHVDTPTGRAHPADTAVRSA